MLNEVGKIEAVTLTRGGLGCALSHIQLWEHVVHINETILVLEDDVRLSPSFQEMYSILSLPKKFDLIYLSYPDFGRRTNWIKNNKKKKYKVERVLGDNWGTSAYIVSPKGAKKLLKNVYPLEVQIDKHMVEMVEESGGGGGGDGGGDGGGEEFVAYVVEPPMVREWKSLHVSDIQRDS